MSFESEMTMAAPAKKLTPRSSDGQTFEVDMAVALESQVIKHMVEDDCVDNVIPIPNVTGSILSKVIKYCKRRVEWSSFPKVTISTLSEAIEYFKRLELDDAKDDSSNNMTWEADFVDVDQDTLFDLILAANYLDIKSLLDVTCQAVADKIKGKTPEEICRTFNVRDEFSPEEEEEIRRENQEAFE